MSKIHIPFGFPDLEARPELKAQPSVSDDLQQTLATLAGYDGSTRRLLRSSPEGILYAVSPRAAAIVKITATAVNHDWQGENLPINEVLIRADTGNAANVLVMIDAPYVAEAAWPLAGNESLQISLDNLSNLHLRIVADTEIVYILYTR